jgi:hypothetical protein
LHPVYPQTGTVPPGAGLPAGASGGETIASRRNKTSRRRGIIFIVVRGCAPYYLFTGESNSEIARKLDSNWEITRIASEQIRLELGMRRGRLISDSFLY